MGDEGLITRRAAIGGALAVGASVAALGCLDGVSAPAHAQEADSSADVAENVRNAQFGFLLRVRNCVDCGECVNACRLWNRIPESAPARRKVEACTLENGKEVYLSTSCMHCAKPACAEVCPARAISKGDGGVVAVDKDRCIGCKYCYQACPYGVPRYTAAGMDKCDCCVGNGVPLGEKPRCVRACKVDALRYGTIDELMEQTKGKAQRVDGATEPSYLLV